MDTRTAHYYTTHDGAHVVIGTMVGTKFVVTHSQVVVDKDDAVNVARRHRASPYNF